MPISADPNTFEGYSRAVPYPDGKTLVVFLHDYYGNSYQIIDKYGQLQFPEPQILSELYIAAMAPAEATSDGNGGAYLVWYISENGEFPGTYAQRLDSLGNRLWGNDEVMITDFYSPYLSLSTDGVGGLLITMGDCQNNSIMAYRLDASGQQLWGNNGVVICSDPEQQIMPSITHDGSGGAYIAWWDNRSYPSGALYMQHLDSEGNILWTPNGIIIHDNPPWFNDIIPDEEGGCIAHCGSGSYNFAYRIAPDGHTLWTRHHVSWSHYSKIVPGESGFFYLGFVYEGGAYGQKMDMEGNLYWPNWSTGQYGAPFCEEYNGWTTGQYPDKNYFVYRAPYFWGLYTYKPPSQSFPSHLLFQALNPQGRGIHGEFGVLVAVTDTNQFYYRNVVPDLEGEGGAVIWDFAWWADVYGKHINSDGSLGGPDPRVRPEVIYPQISGVFNSTLQFTLPEAGRVELDVYNLLGRKVAVIGKAYYAAGSHALGYDLQDLASGVYFVRLKADYGQAVKKVVVR
jgi:hypothetical protein